MGRRKEGNEEKARGGQRAVKREEIAPCRIKRTYNISLYTRWARVVSLDALLMYIYIFQWRLCTHNLTVSRFKLCLRFITLVPTNIYFRLLRLSGGLEYSDVSRFCIRTLSKEEKRRETARRFSPMKTHGNNSVGGGGGMMQDITC